MLNPTTISVNYKGHREKHKESALKPFWLINNYLGYIVVFKSRKRQMFYRFLARLIPMFYHPQKNLPVWAGCFQFSASRTQRVLRYVTPLAESLPGKGTVVLYLGWSECSVRRLLEVGMVTNVLILSHCLLELKTRNNKSLIDFARSNVI